LQYSGANPHKPVYVALNNSVYDVSAAKDLYGQGGAYNFFAGRDCTRAYVTGCFGEDLTPDIRGVEEMFLPVEQEGDFEGVSKAEEKEIRKRELEEAHEKVQQAISHWEGFYSKGKYVKVGTIKRDPAWLNILPKRKLCESAHKQRPKRNNDDAEGRWAPGAQGVGGH
jgi:predicted heme/steroid binding protein